MGKYGGNLTDFGQTNSLYGKNIEAYYRAPKGEYDFSKELEDYDSGELSGQALLDLIPDNWYEENNNDYWEDEKTHFWGKDGQTNAYVKRGVDDEIVEPLDRMQADKFTWYFATDDNHLYFKAGGKIYARGGEWFLLKVITQDSTSSTTNKYNAMDTNPDNKRLLQFGLKTLVLV
jgi:hypothetical protein